MKKFIYAWLALAGAVALAAGEPLSWDRCVEMASRSNPELQAARKSLAAWEDNVRNARGAFLPTLSGSLGYTRTHNEAVGTSPLDTTGYTAGLTASQSLFNGFADQGRLDKARAKREEAAAELALVRSRVSFELKSAFATLSFSQASIGLLQTILERRESNAKLIQLRYRSGAENKGSVMLGESQLEQARLDREQAELALQTAQADLSRLLGLDHASDLVVTGNVPITPPPAVPDFAALAETLPEYRKRIANEHETAADLGLARSGFFPTLNLTAGATNGGVDFFPRDNSQLTFGVAVVIPLFNGTRDYWGTLSAAESHTAATLRRENERRSGDTRLRNAHTAYVVAARQVELSRQFLEAATVRSRIAREKYNNGLMTFEDWDLIENEFISRQKEFLQSERARVTAEAAWEQMQGKGVLP